MKTDGLAARVARKNGVEKKAVRVIIDDFLAEIVNVLRTEEPVVLNNFGEFYFSYSKPRQKAYDNQEIEGKKRKRVKFSPVRNVVMYLNTLVDDIGIDNSARKNLKQAGVDPSDLPSIRKSMEALKTDMALKLRTMPDDVTYEEIAVQLTGVIKRQPEI